jgi:peptide/nickel transport system permease protein
MKWNIRLKTGVVILSVFFVCAFVLTWFCPKDPSMQSSYPPYLKVSWEHLLGTNGLGQDIFWFLMFAIRNSILLGMGVSICTSAIALAVGLSSGYLGGKYDRLMMLLNDSFIVIPSFPILIVLSSMVRGKGGLITIVPILIIFGWAWGARTMRSIALSVREREFVNMAWYSGCSKAKIIVQEFFPYVYAYGIVAFINSILHVINAEAALAVIGLSSIQTPTLGSAVYWAITFSAIMTGRYVWIGAPIVATSLLFLGLFLTSTGYNQYFAERRGHS